MGKYSRHIKNCFYATSAIFPDSITSLYPKRIILPAWHLITDHPPAHIRHLYRVKTKKEFIKDLDYLLKKFKPIDLRELIKISREGSPVRENFFHPTFDDGLRECYEEVSPVLKAKGVPATFFINPDFIDNKEMMFRYKVSLLIDKIIISGIYSQEQSIRPLYSFSYSDRNKIESLATKLGVDFHRYLSKQKPYMEMSQIKKLVSEGFTIGAHSLDHPEYSKISFEEQIRQTKESIQFISQQFGLSYKVFAFPFNDDFISKRFFDMIFSPPLPTDLTFGVAGIKKDYHPFHLQRIPMENTFSGQNIIKGEYLYFFFKSLIGKNMISRK
jgi:peptidoglycan/xylan/chitin deacetylase (PgdA/CDA1 family)